MAKIKSFWINSGIWEKVLVSVMVTVFLSMIGYGSKVVFFVHDQQNVDGTQNACIKSLQVNANEVQAEFVEVNKRVDKTQDEQKDLANKVVMALEKQGRYIEQLQGVSNQILDKLDERPVIWSINELDSICPIKPKCIYLESECELYVDNLNPLSLDEFEIVR